MCARSLDQVESVASGLRSLGRNAVALRCDVTDPASVAAMTAAVREALGPIDILVNNAGVAHSAPLHHQTLDDWNRVLAVNLTGTMLVTQSALPDMVSRGWGRVVNIASIASRMGARYISAYAAAKHGVLGFTRSIAAEVAAKGVTINAVCPGYVDTEMTRETIDRIVAKTGMSPEEALASVTRTTPQRRLFTPDEVAHAVLFLCHHNARGINGQAIGIDGGEVLS